MANSVQGQMVRDTMIDRISTEILYLIKTNLNDPPVETTSSEVPAVDSFFNLMCQDIQVHVAGVPFKASAYNTYLAFFHVLFCQSGGVELCLRRRLTDILSDGLTEWVKFC